MKKLLIFIGLILPLFSKAQGTCATAMVLGTPTTTPNCFNPADNIDNAGGMCTGTAGMGYSDYWFRFCTDASNTCIAFDIDISSSAEWMAALYSGACPGTYVSGSVVCNTIGGGSTGGPGYWSTAGNDPGVSLTTASTCYYLRVQVNDAYLSTTNICVYEEAPPEDACTGALGIDGTPDTYDNACATQGVTDPPPAQLCAGSLENTFWYSFTTTTPCGPPCNVVITTANIDCAGGGEGFQIGYFSGTCGSLTNLGCASGSAGTVNATLTGATAGTTYYVAIDGNAGANCFYDISATNTVPLPVELLYYRGFADDMRNAQLQWATASEQEASHFQIWKSTDGKNYTLVGSLIAKNSPQGDEYRLTDPQKLMTGVTYYKLIQFDYDGNSKTYEPIAIVTKPSDDDVVVVPNPVNNIANIIFNAANQGNARLVISDMFGRVAIDETVGITEGGNSLQFDVSAFSSGMYLGRIYMDNNIISVKFTK